MMTGMPSTKTNQAKSKTQRIEEILEPWVPPALMGLLYDVKSFAAYQKFHSLIKSNVELKNIHHSDRCFIIGSGPSIKEQDLRPLRDEIVIPLNNFYVHPNFQEIMGGNRTKYYLTAPLHGPNDRNTWVNWLEAISDHVPDHTKMLFGVNNYPDNIASILSEHKLFHSNDIYWYLTNIRHIEKHGFNKRFIDLSCPIMACGTASVYALIFAVYMGFKEIFLVGIDHSNICCKLTSQSAVFYKNALHQHEDVQKSENTVNFSNFRNIFLQYQSIKNSTTSNIVNLSNNSLLDIFNFNDLEKVLKD